MRKPTHPDNADLTGLIRGNWLVEAPVDGFRTLWLCRCLACQSETRTYPRSRLTGKGGRLHGCAANHDKPDTEKVGRDLNGQPITWADLGDPCV